MESPWPERTVKALRAITFVCDVITFPVYYLIQQPWKYQRLAKRIKVSGSGFVQVGDEFVAHVLICSTFEMKHQRDRKKNVEFCPVNDVMSQKFANGEVISVLTLLLCTHVKCFVFFGQ